MQQRSEETRSRILESAKKLFSNVANKASVTIFAQKQASAKGVLPPF
jgi:predicted RNA binding protein with dsRBD fold (UPF0201 family)